MLQRTWSKIQDGKRWRELFEKSYNGDTWTFSFKINVNYFGEAEQILTLLETLMDHGRILRVKTLELTRAKCLAQEVFNKLERIERRLGEAPVPTPMPEREQKVEVPEERQKRRVKW